jgi:S1-C subfamily serine protease
MKNGEVAEATLMWRDPATDLALLRLPKSGGRPMARAQIDQVRVGHMVLAVGRPGESVQATLGIISATDGGWRPRFGSPQDAFVQSDVVMYPGFSGGGLVDAWGRLVGMNTSGLLRGVSLSIPTTTIERVAGMLAEHGRVRRGYLGVGVQPARLPSGQGAAEQATGLLVASVEAGSPAEKAGILLGDVLLSLGSTTLATMDDLLGALSGDVVGTTVTVELLRGGKAASQQVTVGERAAPSDEEE